MSDQDLTREFQTKCVVSENVTDSENNNNNDNSPCSYCDARKSDASTTRSCQAQTKSHSKNPSPPECRYDDYLPKSWRLYAKSTVSRDLLLKGAMTLRGDGVVEGEIKGQVFSHGDDELVKGETGFEAISDTDDEGDGELCCVPKQSKLNSDAVGVKFKSLNSKSTMPGESSQPAASAGETDDATPRPRKYVLDQRTYASSKKSGGAGSQASQKSKNIPKEAGSHFHSPSSSLASSPTGAPAVVPHGHYRSHHPPYPPYHYDHHHYDRHYYDHRPYHHYPQHYNHHHHHHHHHHRLRNGERFYPVDIDVLCRENLVENRIAP